MATFSVWIISNFNIPRREHKEIGNRHLPFRDLYYNFLRANSGSRYLTTAGKILTKWGSLLFLVGSFQLFTGAIF
jgi:hypothetical protein